MEDGGGEVQSAGGVFAEEWVNGASLWIVVLVLQVAISLAK